MTLLSGYRILLEHTTRGVLIRVAHWGPADADALDQKEYSVRLMGGEALRMRLEATDLSAVSELLRRERALVGHLIIEEDGCPLIVEALVPSHRIQLVLAHDD